LGDDMSMEHAFDRLKKSAKDDAEALAARFLQVNADMTGMIERAGILIEYERERDHLYMTLGEPREGMALTVGHLVVLADPETLEFIGFEIPDFKKAVETDALKEWARILPFIEWQPVVHIPPAAHNDEVTFPREIAEGVQRELVHV